MIFFWLESSTTVRVCPREKERIASGDGDFVIVVIVDVWVLCCDTNGLDRQAGCGENNKGAERT